MEIPDFRHGQFPQLERESSESDRVEGALRQFRIEYVLAEILDDILASCPDEFRRLEDALAHVLCAAIERRPSSEVTDPFEIYPELVNLPASSLRDIFYSQLCEPNCG